MLINKIVSGGQTGVDIAALDVAIEFCINYGGWTPKGATNEYKEKIDQKYNLVETPDEAVEQRTEWNVRDSDATLIIYRGKLTGGTDYTRVMALKHDKPHLLIDLATMSIPEAVDKIIQWLPTINCTVLNISGPRETEDSEIYKHAKKLISTLLISQIGVVERNGNFEIALKIYEQAYSNIRHWDQIRWLIPYWFATLAAAVTGGIAYFSEKGHETYTNGALFILSIFSFLCLYLMIRLEVYHNKQISKIDYIVKFIPTPLKSILINSMPDYSTKRIIDRIQMATFWFMLAISIFGIASFVLSIKGFFHI